MYVPITCVLRRQISVSAYMKDDDDDEDDGSSDSSSSSDEEEEGEGEGGAGIERPHKPGKPIMQASRMAGSPRQGV